MADTCQGAFDIPYLVTVETWEPPDCTRVILDLDLYWELTIDGGSPPVYSSGSVGCPGVWSETVCTYLGGVVRFDLKDYDPVGDDEWQDELCWPEPTNMETPCGSMSVDVLLSGAFEGSTLYGDARVTFEPVSSCD